MRIALQPPLQCIGSAALANAPRRAARWRRRRRSATRPRPRWAAPAGRRRPRRPGGGFPCPRRRARAPSGRSGRPPRAPPRRRRRRPRSRSPAAFASPSQSARLRTRAISRCSTAPADALQAAAVTAAERRSGMTTPPAPANSAERQTAPRLRGSWTWSRATSSGVSPRSIAPRVGVGIGIDLGDDALVIGRAAEPLQLLRRGLRRPPDAMDRAASPARPRRPAARRR